MTPIHYGIVFIFIMLVRNVSEVFIQHRRPRHHEKKGMASLLVFTTSHFASTVAVAYLLIKADRVHAISFLAGLIVLLAGFAGRVSAIREMGMSYSQYLDPDPAGRLVTNGIYSLTRNPLYLCFSIEALGLMIVRFNYISLAAFFVIVMDAVYRGMTEERLLADKYGEEYSAYRAKTKMFIPYIV